MGLEAMKFLEALGIGLIVLGLLFIVISILTPSSHSVSSGGFAGCIVIFFIPICFGGGQASQQLIAISALLTIILVIFAFIGFLLLVRRRSSGSI
jgi:uncharacterized membrane protein